MKRHRTPKQLWAEYLGDEAGRDAWPGFSRLLDPKPIGSAAGLLQAMLARTPRPSWQRMLDELQTSGKAPAAG